MRRAFPDLIPALSLKEHFKEADEQGNWYNIASLRVYVHSVLVALDVEISEGDETPVIETRTFGFIADPASYVAPQPTWSHSVRRP